MPSLTSSQYSLKNDTSIGNEYKNRYNFWRQFNLLKASNKPTILRVGRYRFYFFSNENNEPPHIHIKAESDQAKFWLKPIELASNYGFKAYELNEIEKIIIEHNKELLEAWNEHFG